MILPQDPVLFDVDDLDKKILQQLLSDSRKSYQEVARELNVSGGTVHVRMNKLKEAGVVKGSKLVIDMPKLGLGIVAFVGINLLTAKDYTAAVEQLNKLPEVIEVFYTTGKYNLFAKVVTKGMRELHYFLIEKLQPIAEIQSTETLVALDAPIEREVRL